MTFSMVPSEQLSDRQPLHVAISEQLKEKIEAGEYEPGNRLPSEFDLGAIFGVSRTTIRKAITNLIQQGLVTTQQGKGIFVTEKHKISFSMSNPLMYFDAALKQQGFLGRVQSLRFQLINPTPEVSRKLQLTDPRAKSIGKKRSITPMTRRSPWILPTIPKRSARPWLKSSSTALLTAPWSRARCF
jgi:GntR family transcriptional regulator